MFGKNLKDRLTSIKKKEVPISELTSELDKLKKEKREVEFRQKTLSEIKNLKREKNPAYRIAKKVAGNIRTEIDKDKTKAKKGDSYLDRLGQFGKW